MFLYFGKNSKYCKNYLYQIISGVLILFVLKKFALIFSMIILSYIGDGDGDADYRSFFASWLIFFVLILIDYIEQYNYKVIEEKNLSKMFYVIGIVLFSLLTVFSLLGSIGLFLVEDSIVIANTEFIIIKGLFLFSNGNILNIETFIYLTSIVVVVFLF